MPGSIAAIVGGAAGAIVLVLMVIGIAWFCLVHCKNSNKNSETGSSDPSALVEWNKGGGMSSAGGAPVISESRGTRQFGLEELEQATRHFSENNLIGEGRFGLVYKGLLRDGTVVAIKRRSSAPRKEFVEEVYYLSEIRHRNIVNLIGYCQEDNLQMLIYEYLPNGSVCSHLYDTGLESMTQLEFKQRLSIAIGAAKGLCHLHCLTPPLVHKDFKTANVLVDESFIAKVADGGLSKLLERIDEAGPSSRMIGVDVFLDPEIRELGTPSEMSDVYSFGVFLLELVTGQEAERLDLSESDQSLVQWVETRIGSNNFTAIVDSRMGSSFTSEGIREFVELVLRCLDPKGNRRPTMNFVVSELDRILEKEMTLTTVMGEGTAIVTLGSHLFTSV